MLETVILGGLPIACLSNQQTSDVFMRVIEGFKAGDKPYMSTSANGEVVTRANQNAEFKDTLISYDMINADGMPLVWASRYLTKMPLPERVATTDLFHVVARDAERLGKSFYFLATTQDELDLAVANIKTLYPALKIVGAHHGYVQSCDDVLEEIEAAAPDVLWLGMGVPREQAFALTLREKLTKVAVIKTCGGLFNYISGTAPRAPQWMQKASLEWLYRVYLEPKRLAWRYFSTNPAAIWHLVTKTG